MDLITEQTFSRYQLFTELKILYGKKQVSHDPRVAKHWKQRDHIVCGIRLSCDEGNVKDPLGQCPKQWARSIQPKFPEISVQNSMDRFGPIGKVLKKRDHLLRWTSFPGRTGPIDGWMDRAQYKHSII